MYKIKLDKSGYLTGFYEDAKGEVEVLPSDMMLEYINCYKIENGNIVFDEEKYESIVLEEEKALEISELKEYLISTSDVDNDFIEQLFSLTNPLTFVSDLISLMSTYKNTYKTILNKRRQARDRLKELEG